MAVFLLGLLIGISMSETGRGKPGGCKSVLAPKPLLPPRPVTKLRKVNDKDG